MNKQLFLQRLHSYQTLLKRFFLSLKNIRISKRQQFVMVTLSLTLCMMATQLISGGLQLEVLFGLMLAAYVLSAIVLRQELSGWEYVTLLTLPTLYTGAVFLFYFLLPERWLTRLPIAFLYAIGMYAILLTENIFNVAASRTIQLLRAAQSVGFLLTLVTAFFLIDTILSLRLPFYGNTALLFLVSFPLSLQSLWSMELAPKVSARIWWAAFVISLLLAESGLVLSFWPIRINIAALFLTTIFYTLVGMLQQFLVERLFTKTIREFVIVFCLVLVLILYTTKWGSGM